MEFGHMVMGPSCGMILADLGAEVIKIEPKNGDKTRMLGSFGSGFHCTYNRNKKSLAIDIKSEQGKRVLRKLIDTADVVTENFREGTLERQGLGYDDLKRINPRIIYCSMKGFLSGPYEHRAALDEVVQMMGGLAYMTGPPGRPTRAGASVNDIMGGMFGAIGILAALTQREKTGVGTLIKSGLYENCALLMAQYIASFHRTGRPSKPLFHRETQPWPVYDLFDTASDQQIFVGLVTEGQWLSFCEEFQLQELIDDPSLNDNAGRVAARDKIFPLLTRIFATCTIEDIVARLDQIGCPYAPVAKPEDLLDDVHMNASGGFVDVEVEPGRTGKIPALPLQLDGNRLELRNQPPFVGEHSRELIQALGYTDDDIDKMLQAGAITETDREESQPAGAS